MFYPVEYNITDQSIPRRDTGTQKPLQASNHGKTTAYFRGRKLHGKKLKVPKGYRGLVLTSTDRILPTKEQSPGVKNGDEGSEGDEDAEEVPGVKVVEEMSEFDDIMIWGHETLADETDPYMKGVEEWVLFAERIHSHSEEEMKDECGIKDA
ncbi:Uncharacterized protein BP5553_04309 [Venustampulla echinocandica]|uniref:Uncharacterized protein n=1 Tax=Venustampulla echinocandica TaxID=2656787 RepID=A0A370TWS5_9HELO|nr:Uncharacterized protein BP5553_04309 [Venustampulla echinocandica]RDL39969.1 Uncharacterized protein BP5553_04309 [Venustampulla echinocandica]